MSMVEVDPHVVYALQARRSRQRVRPPLDLAAPTTPDGLQLARAAMARRELRADQESRSTTAE